MRCFCISDDPDVLTGLRLAGIGGVRVRTAAETDEAISAACAQTDIALLLVTDGCYSLCRERLDELKLSAERPLVNVIPDSRGARSEGDHITRLITEAIGVKL